MQNLTIEQIKEATNETFPYFFDFATLKGFGQTLESFKVVESPKGNIYIYAPSYWGEIIGDSHLRVNALGKGYTRITIGSEYPRLKGKNLIGYTFRLFTGNSLKTCDCEKDLESILEYIKNN